MAKGPSKAASRDDEAAREPAPSLIVGIGASAGGLEAYKTFFSLMPADSGMAFVLIQHLDPKRPSMLVDLLSSATAMRVVQAEDGAQVEANHVYVIPPDATLTMEDDVLRLVGPAPPRELRRPIDVFFTSLAEAQQDNSVCIVLSGGGSDGSAGLEAVKEHGGLTLAQADIDSKAKLGMPSSAAATGLVDAVLTVEQMPEKLLSYQRDLATLRRGIGTDGKLAGASEDLAKICRIVRGVVGHDFSQYKDKTLMRRIQRRMQVLHLATTEDYVSYLRKEPREARLLFQEFLIGVTSFFRDAEAFEALDAEALPHIVTNRGADDVIRVWVAGCSTGEEAYSIAILLKERLAKQAGAAKLQLFATDIDEQAVAFARAGRYRLDQLEGVSPARRKRWFVQENDRWQPTKEIREACVFSIHSAIKDPPFSKLDLVVCRNLLIYLQPPAQERLIGVFQYALRPGGFLFLGASETLSRQGKGFNVTDKKHRIFQRRDSGTAALPHLSAPAADKGAPQLGHAARPMTSADDRLDISARRAMEEHFPAYVVVDGRHDVVRFSGPVGSYLVLSPGAASLNLLNLLQRPLRPAARTLLQKAMRERQSASQHNLLVEIDGAQHRVDLVAKPIAGAESADYCVLAFLDHGPAPLAASAPGGGDLHDLEQELAVTRERLQATIDELETNNEEMKSANEEYQSVNEELQSTNEELETSKEEMQSINEELQTVNAELGAKNDTMLRLNSDLRNFLDSTEIATIFLDGQLHVTNFTPAMTDLFHLRESDHHRPITEIASRFEYADLADDVARVQRTLTMVEHEIETSAGRSFTMRIRPYRRSDNVIDGVVITFVDITERKRLETERALRAAMVDSASDAIIGLDGAGKVTSWNAGAEALYGYSPAEAVGKNVETIIPAGRKSGEYDFRARIADGNRVEDYDTVGRRKDGGAIEISVGLSPVKNDKGAIVGAALIVRDIAERKRREADKTTLAAIVNSSDDAIISKNLNGLILSWNRGAEALFGYSAKEAVGKPIAMLLPADRKEEEDAILARVRAGQSTDHYDTVRQRKDGRLIDISLTVSPIKNADGEIIGASKVARDITDRKRWQARQEMLMSELDHRVKNTLATVQAIANQTAAGETDPQAFQEAFRARIAALARAHNLLAQGEWVGSSLQNVAQSETQPYSNGDASRCVIEGPDVSLKPQASLALGMAFHELATNAAKYGAFSAPSGRVAIRWGLDGTSQARRLRLEWRESGGPPVEEPKSRGMGSRLIERGLVHELGGEAKLNFERAGVRFTLEAPLDSVEAPR